MKKVFKQTLIFFLIRRYLKLLENVYKGVLSFLHKQRFYN